ncbi:MAG: MFS transporter [Candidatus Cloacimonetes bacterium]|nr:MFS transporter [Candidatus Cloacimonadota bacterium]
MKLNRLEKQTFLLLLGAAIFNGFVTGSFQVQDIIAKKALHALDWQITILVMLWPVSNLISIWWGKLLEHSQSISRFFILTAVMGRLPLLLMLFVSGFNQYLLIMALLFSFNALISPAQNTIYQSNFQKKNRGLAFGYIASVTTLIILVFSFVSGRLLDMNENWFRQIFGIVGIMGVIGAVFFAVIRIRKTRFHDKAFLSIRELFISPVRRSFEVLHKNRYFAYFERNFFIYGIAYMILLPAIPKYLVEYLKMDYSETFLAKGIISQVGILLLAPLAGKIFDRKNPAYFSFLTYASLTLYPVLLLLSSFFIGYAKVNYIVYFAFLLFGISMSAIFISWNISSIFFANEEDVSMYQGLHVTLTGLRALFAPFLGYLIMRLLSVQAVFVFAAILFLLASALSYKLYLHMMYEEMKLNSREVKHFIYLRKIFPFN